jgi:carboxyl-terminal processing protease
MRTTPQRLASILLAALLLGGCEAAFEPRYIPGSEDARMSGRAFEYLDSALNLMQSHALQKHQVDWRAFRNEAFMRAAGAELPAHTYPAIHAALQKLNRHSFFIPPQAGPGSGVAGTWPGLSAMRLVSGRFGYIRTAPYNDGNPDGHAQAYHDLIREVDTPATCGWVVDTRGNAGGNMWPMLAGIGPILGEGRPGSFLDADGVRTPWYYAGGVAGVERGGHRQPAARAARPYRLRRQTPPVAVLTGIGTASAAEALVIAFRGRADARSFGLVTHGLPTANTSFQMPDGAYVVLTTAWEADRNGVVYRNRIEPDEVVVGRAADPATDETLARALQWLSAHPACQAPAAE